MVNDFIDSLALSEDEKARVEELGAESVPMLLGQLCAAPDAAASFLGDDLYKKLLAAAESRLRATERSILQMQTPQYHDEGAVIGPPPQLSEPGYDLEQRDILHGEWLRLRQKPEKSPEESRRMSDLESQLTSMLGHS